jgi:hypothetical protein
VSAEYSLSPDDALAALQAIARAPRDQHALVRSNPALQAALSLWLQCLEMIASGDRTLDAADINRLLATYRPVQLLAGGKSVHLSCQIDTKIFGSWRLNLQSNSVKKPSGSDVLRISLDRAAGHLDTQVAFFVSSLAEQAQRRPRRVFCGFASEDRKYARELSVRLRNLDQHGLSKTTMIEDVCLDESRRESQEQMIDEAELILLLVSPDLLDSSRWQVERAMQRRRQSLAALVPILLRPTYGWEEVCMDLTPLPKDGRPVTTWSSQDSAWDAVVTSLGAFLESSA